MNGAAGAAEGDQIRLKMPASGPFTRLARVAVTSLATRLGFSFDEVEELRLAVGEVCAKLIDHAPTATHIDVVFEIGDGQLTVDIGVDGDAHVDGSVHLGDLTDQIIDATVDDVTYLEDAQVIRVVKTRSEE